MQTTLIEAAKIAPRYQLNAGSGAKAEL